MEDNYYFVYEKKNLHCHPIFFVFLWFFYLCSAYFFLEVFLVIFLFVWLKLPLVRRKIIRNNFSSYSLSRISHWLNLVILNIALSRNFCPVFWEFEILGFNYIAVGCWQFISSYKILKCYENRHINIKVTCLDFCQLGIAFYYEKCLCTHFDLVAKIQTNKKCKK